MHETRSVVLALHGGAGPRLRREVDVEVDRVRSLAEAARDRLLAGAAALDVVVETVAALEASGLFIAGRGASPNTAGDYELDASLVNGTTGAAGAVAALQGFRSPIRVAEAVMRETPHVLLAGKGAASFARGRGLAEIDDPRTWFTPVGRGEGAPERDHGTVGCVVRDLEGRLAAGTSTGGVHDKLPGRVGDTPIVGAGVWADRGVAVCCTGQGEYFVRVAAAAQVAMRMRFGGARLVEATQAALTEVAALGGQGGLIAIDAEGAISMPFNSEGMYRAALHPDGRIEAAFV